MEQGGGSGERSRITVKIPQSSSGRNVSSSTGTRRNFQMKRSRMVVSDSESSDEFMKPPHRSVDRKTLGARGSSQEKFTRKRDTDVHGRNGFVMKNNEASGSLMKMSELDIYEFDEYDGFDSANLMRKRFDNGSVGVNGRSSFPPRMVDSSVGGSGPGREPILYRRRKAYVTNDANSMSSQDKYSSESDSDEPVRLQGRNGVLKVKVNNKASTFAASNNHQEAEIYERPPSSLKPQKRENVVVKPIYRQSSSVNNDSESEESDVSRKPKRKKSECRKFKKEINTKSKSTFSEPVKPGVREERKGRRTGGTEKQKLRERIKGMLTDAGWTIDYRPRRNQSYQDAVYVNPSGTAYWSIVKAYEALMKQLNEEEIDAISRKDVAVVASVSEDIVNNLARKVKKTRTEMTKKWKKDSSDSESEKESDDEGGGDSDTREERMGSFVKLAVKLKKRGKNKTDWDDLRSKRKRSSYYDDARPFSGSDSHYQHGRQSKKIGRCTLLVRSSEDKKNPAVDGFNPYSGKRTLLSWLIDCGVVQLRQKVQYMNHQCTKIMMEGWITRAGIHCDCCSKILTVSRFEIHAGSKSCQPFQNIYLESGSSLLHCQIKAWNMQKDAKNLGFHVVDTDGDDPDDDACGICGDGGNLICCDGCPSTYHQTCLGMEVLPVGDWHCPNCTCKFCDATVDSGGEDRNNLSLLSCNMCERRYHQSCMSELEGHKVQSIGPTSSFCGSKCLELFEKLQKYLGVKNELEGGYSWSLIHRVDTDSHSNAQLATQRIVNNSKLAVGLGIMDECFLPIIDRRSGINIIRNVLYNSGSNFNRINYRGFYTAILERGDEIISAASLRFHGMQLAEMPFIGTRHIYRRQGMCRRLFDAIESAMRSLKVEKLVIPAIPDFLHAWTGNFGFSPLDDSVKKEMRSLNTLVFPGIDMLQKPLLHKKTVIAVVHGVVVSSEIKTEKESEFVSSTENGLHSNEFVADGGDCYKNILVADEEKVPVSAMDTISKADDDELRRYIPDTKKFGDTGSSSCEDVNVVEEAVASLVSSQEIQQVSTDFLVEKENNNLSSCRGSSDMSSITQEVKSASLENNILGTGATLAESKDNAFADGFLL